MLFKGRIYLTDKITTKEGAKLTSIIMTDATKPVSLRTRGDFVIWLDEERRKTLPEGELVDEILTIRVSEMSGNKGGAGVKLKGQIIFGDVPVEKVLEAKEGELPTRPMHKESAAKTVAK